MSDVLDAPIRVSDSAAARIAEILKEEPAGTMLRLAVNGGGCSGFQYAFTLDTETTGDDIVIEKHGATVVVDSMSTPFLAGSVLDFVDDLVGAAFKVVNPNATASCGCGTSFSV
ncbi:iron-sulfur cluster insertion protein ErpA [Futiania mangrovi]|uniref:Iron-sulfur cluster insertion protein ErpA n=1 Tax=Futiania mangrovi TaxID=2959716 RepID=A0A9J6PIT5_9PROT|nr:iron-sulfur cluster insertion protein ErpA [Futiania mangrovii]MCP1335986.1 iron-sulfur cluster insertion protein ErpA [Futiania mangrovii]